MIFRRDVRYVVPFFQRRYAWERGAAWAKKRPALAHHSLLAIDQRLVEKHTDGFDEASIEARSERLARDILAVWPGPPANAL